MLEDKQEGITSKLNFEYRADFYRWMKENGDIEKTFSEEDIIEEVQSWYESEKKLKSINCVNCWNKYKFESIALWKIYSDFNKGIMIKSSISRLKKALEFSTEEIRLSEVHYIDYSKEIMPDGNAMFPLIYKQLAYSYEEEVRLIHQVEHDGWVHDWSKEEVQEGVCIKADLTQLVEEIVISPYSPKWFHELVKNVSLKYELDKPVKRSILSLDE